MNMKRFAFVAALFIATSGFAIGPTTKANDDSCDIALQPAATLLLPHFEVDFTDPGSHTTLFSVTNVTNLSRIARVTLWTDFSYPVLSFNIYLTGYDVQSINLYDVIANGVIAGGSGTGPFSDPNPDLDLSSCANAPSVIPPAFVTRIQEAFTLGIDGNTCHNIGHAHEHAVGYATIDVVGNCSTATPADAEYFTTDIRYDNVLAGDYQQLDNRAKHAQLSPMVHIRAIPEGGTHASRKANPAAFANRFSRTFYGRFQTMASGFNSDARQPLPSRFATRWINGGAGGFETAFKIWRQSATGRDINCATIDDNGGIGVADSVVFDENENGEGIVPPDACFICFPFDEQALPTTSLTSIADSEVFPQSVTATSVAGWLYVNLDDGNTGNGAHQGWLVASMRAGTYSGDMDAVALGNGCSPAVGDAEASEGGSVVIGPSPNGEPEP